MAAGVTASERRERWTWVVVALLAVAAGVWATAASAAFLPHTSGNPDEAVYLFQADLLRRGEVFAPAPTHDADAFQPLFTAHRGGWYVPKYSPVHAAFLAVGLVAVGTARAGLALIAAGVVGLGLVRHRRRRYDDRTIRR